MGWFSKPTPPTPPQHLELCMRCYRRVPAVYYEGVYLPGENKNEVNGKFVCNDCIAKEEALLIGYGKVCSVCRKELYPKGSLAAHTVLPCFQQFDDKLYCLDHIQEASDRAAEQYQLQLIGSDWHQELRARIKAEKEAPLLKKQEMEFRREQDHINRLERQERLDEERRIERQKREDRQTAMDELRVEKHDQSMRHADQKEADRRIDRIERNERDVVRHDFTVERQDAWREDRGERKIADARRNEIMEDNQQWRLEERQRVLEERAKREAELAKKIAEEAERQRLEDEKWSPKDFGIT
jgi:hypothetical protein